MEFKPRARSDFKEIKLWELYPVSNRFQSITDVNIGGGYSQNAVYSESTYSNTILFVKWDQEIKNPRLTLRFEATRQEVIRKDFPEKEALRSKSDYTVMVKKNLGTSLSSAPW